MEAGKLLRKVHMNCPLCDKVHEVEERKRMTSIVLKGEEVTYEERFYFCANADEEENEFETGTMTNENLLNARNAYRIKKGLLTSYEIVEIRESYGLSQVDLAKLLGWGEATISRYESKAIQDEAYDTMLRLIKDDPMKALEFLNKNSDKFTSAKRSEIKANITENLEDYGKEYLTRQTFAGEYVIFENPSDSNGFTTLNIDKIEGVVSYIAEKESGILETQLMRMLWYSDVLSYIDNGVAMTGLVYRKEKFGALPIGYYNMMNLDNVNVKEEMDSNYDMAFRVYPCERVSKSVLSKNDKIILDRVVEKFKDYRAKDLVEYIHEEKAYMVTKQGDIIPFSLTKDIKGF